MALGVSSALVFAALAGGWSAPEVLETGEVKYPVAAGSERSGLLVWTQGGRVRWREARPDGLGRVNTVPGVRGDVRPEEVALASSGHGVLCLKRSDSEGDDVLVSLKPRGGPFGRPRVVGGGPEGAAAIACGIASTGDAVASWLETAPTNVSIRWRLASISGDEMQVATLGRRIGWGPVSVAVTPLGAPLAAGATSSEDGERVGVVAVPGALREVDASEESPAVGAAIDSTGAARVAWTDGTTLRQLHGPPNDLVKDADIEIPRGPVELALAGDITAWYEDQNDGVRPHARALLPGNRLVDLGEHGSNGVWAAGASDGSGLIVFDRPGGRVVVRKVPGSTQTITGRLDGLIEPAVIAWRNGRGLVAWVDYDGKSPGTKRARLLMRRAR